MEIRLLQPLLNIYEQILSFMLSIVMFCLNKRKIYSKQAFGKCALKMVNVICMLLAVPMPRWFTMKFLYMIE